MILNIEEIDVAMSSSKEPKLTSKMLYHQNLDLKKKIHFNKMLKQSRLIRWFYKYLFKGNFVFRFVKYQVRQVIFDTRLFLKQYLREDISQKSPST